MSDELSPVPIRPIAAALKGPGKYQTARSLENLAEFLVGQWPNDKKTDAWRAAMSACLRALEAQINGQAAREAFIMAARDADIPLIADPALMDYPRKREPNKRIPTWVPGAY